MGIYNYNLGKTECIKEIITERGVRVGVRLESGVKILDERFEGFEYECNEIADKYAHNLANLRDKYERDMRKAWVKAFETDNKVEVKE